MCLYSAVMYVCTHTPLFPFFQNLYAPDPDPDLIVEYYERTFEQNDTLGLNDMKTENYC